MRWVAHKTVIRILTVAGAALALALLALSTLVAITPPAQAGSQPGPTAAPAHQSLPPPRPLQQGVSIVKSASTALDPANGATVADGGWITYTITVRNNDPTPLTDVTILDILPSNTLDENSITCLDQPVYSPCVKIQDTVVISDPITTTQVVISVTTQISWTVATLTPSTTISRQFKARVVCNPDGYSFQNGAILYPGSWMSNLVQTIVRVSPPAENGQTQLSNGPTWCSTEPSGAVDMDWGDYDGDGDLDLILGTYGSGTSSGAVVYRNDAGQLTRVGRIHAGSVRGVRWADFNNDGQLDVLVTDDYDSAPSPIPPNSALYPGNYPRTGYNYIYKNTGGSFALHNNGAGYTFQSSDSIFRAAVADYDEDGDVDIAAASLSGGGGCGLQLYKNIAPANLGSDPPSPGNDVFQATIDWGTSNMQCLIADEAVYSLAWGDYNNDGLLELAAGRRGRIEIFQQNASHVFSTAPTYAFTDLYSALDLPHWFPYDPYDLAWGDYDGDGLLDLAAAVQQPYGYDKSRVQIYRNTGGTFGASATIVIPTDAYYLRAIDWADFNGDGKVELVVADVPPKIYAPTVSSSTPILVLPATTGGRYEVGVRLGGCTCCWWCWGYWAPGWHSYVWGIRGIDQDNDGDMDLAFADFAGRSLKYTNFAPFLSPEVQPVDTAIAATSVAWGDVNGGGPDFLLGTVAALHNKLYYNNNGAFPPPPGTEFLANGRNVAFGDVNGDHNLDVAFGRSSGNHIYLNGHYGFPDWTSQDSPNTYSLIFGDFDQDNQGWLDLIAGNSNGPNTLYLNQDGGFGSGTNRAPVWASSLTNDTRSVAWGYYDGDDLPDFAAGNYGQPTQIYRNAGYNRFNLAQTLPAANTRSVAWGDYDGDGAMDLALGNYNQPVQVYRNTGGNLTLAWTAPVTRNTTSVAWGDWNSDGRLDLAVGNNNQPNQVYANLGSTPGSPKLFWLWQSAVAYDTQSVAWGDADGDGDLDLAIANTNQSGFYRNSYVAPAHLTNMNMPLPLNSTYLVVQPPVPATGQIWYRTVLSNPTSLKIPIRFTVYDPDGPLQNGSRNDLSVIVGQYAITSQLQYMFSLDGGGNWQPVTTGTLSYDAGARRYTFEWGAGQDLNDPSEAVSDNVCFRISTAHQNKGGRVQRARTGAVSPPFRVRNLSCVWPEDAWIAYQPPVTAGTAAQFTGWVIAGPSQVFFSWDFGDGSPPPPPQGQIMKHTYQTNGTYVITLTVTGSSCPVDRATFATTTVTVGAAHTLTGTIYLPIILKSSIGSSTAGAATPGIGILTLDVTPGSPAQVTGFWGDVQPDTGFTRLRWDPSLPDDAVLGYRVYRSSVESPGFRRLAEVPATVTTYTDAAATCGYAYFVTAYNAQGESLASTSSYYSPPCR